MSATSTATPVYAPGQTVNFEGRVGIVLSATKPKADIFGHVVQQLSVSTYAGTSLIGSRHSGLSPVE